MKPIEYDDVREGAVITNVMPIMEDAGSKIIEAALNRASSDQFAGTLTPERALSYLSEVLGVRSLLSRLDKKARIAASTAEKHAETLDIA